jgi:protein-disulfide isomerase
MPHPPDNTAPDLDPPVTDTDHAAGPADAPVTLVEYGDYECPSCLNAEPVVRQLRDHFGPRLRYVFRHFPQNSVHPSAYAAAQAAEAAGAQGQFWSMHALLFAHQHDLGDVDFDHLALSLGLEIYRYQSDRARELYVRRVADHLASGQRSGVRGTPTFFINGARYAGPINPDALARAIESAAKTPAKNR